VGLLATHPRPRWTRESKLKWSAALSFVFSFISCVGSIYLAGSHTTISLWLAGAYFVLATMGIALCVILCETRYRT
jgi:uncharacterized membrane protein YagU involved in acid resistance